MIPFMVGYDILTKYGVFASNSFLTQLCNISNSIGCYVFLSGIAVAGGFLAFEAQTLQEYSDNFYILLALINGTVSYAAIKFKTEMAFQLFGKIEEIIKNRKHFFFLVCYSIDDVVR